MSVRKVRRVRTTRKRIVYLAPRMTRPWLTMKYAQALADGGADVRVFATSENAWGYDLGVVKTNVEFRVFPPSPYLPFVWRNRWLSRLRVPIPSRELVWALVRERADIYVAGEPDDLPIASVAAKIAWGEIAYIPFEYYPGLSYGDESALRLYRRLEARYAHRVRSWVSLGDKLTEEYRRAYGLGDNVHTVYSSLPRSFEAPPAGLRGRIGARPEWTVVLYQGLVSKNRGVWDVVEALPDVPETVHFVVIGSKDTDQLRVDARALGVGGRVHVIDFVPQNVLMGYTAEADIGIIPIRDVCLSYRYCNPGKLFEFIAAGLPLAVSALPQLEWYVRTRGLGEVFEPSSRPGIAQAITRLTLDREYRMECARASRRVQETEACWEIQSAKLRRAVLG